MNIHGMTDEAIALELGLRIQRLRLNRNKSQDQVADEAGVSKPTIIQLERGQGKITTLIAVMRTLGMLDQVDQIVPEIPASPIQVHKMSGVVRQRAFNGRSTLKTETSAPSRDPTGKAKNKRVISSPVTHNKRPKKDNSEW